MKHGDKTRQATANRINELNDQIEDLTEYIVIPGPSEDELREAIRFRDEKKAEIDRISHRLI